MWFARRVGTARYEPSRHRPTVLSVPRRGRRLRVGRLLNRPEPATIEPVRVAARCGACRPSRARSSGGQSTGLLSRGPQVRVLPGAPFDSRSQVPVAALAHCAERPNVGPGAPAVTAPATPCAASASQASGFSLPALLTTTLGKARSGATDNQLTIRRASMRRCVDWAKSRCSRLGKATGGKRPRPGWKYRLSGLAAGASSYRREYCSASHRRASPPAAVDVAGQHWPAAGERELSDTRQEGLGNGHPSGHDSHEELTEGAITHRLASIGEA